MARPLYETESDRTAEAKAKKRVAEAWKATIYKLPMRYKLDWAFEKDGHLFAVAEYKKRDIAHGLYDEIILSLDKVMAGLELADTLQVPFYFFVEFTDGLRYVHITRVAPTQVQWHGRSVKKRDWQDMEPCVMIKSVLFETVNGDD